MSKNRIAILLLIVGLTAIIGFFVGKNVLGGSQLKPVEVSTAKPITTDYVKPDPAIFNETGINPTTTITIKDNNQNLLGN